MNSIMNITIWLVPKPPPPLSLCDAYGRFFPWSEYIVNTWANTVGNSSLIWCRITALVSPPHTKSPIQTNPTSLWWPLLVTNDRVFKESARTYAHTHRMARCQISNCFKYTPYICIGYDIWFIMFLFLHEITHADYNKCWIFLCMWWTGKSNW